MKSRLLLIIPIMLLALVASGMAQVAGDYRSAVNNGKWNTAATWETFDGSNWVTATATPGATNDVTIRNNYNVIVDASGKNCKNLTIEAGAVVKGDSVLPNSNIRYVRVNGSTVTVNGMYGDSAGTGTTLSLEAAGNNNTVTITGTGVFAPARVRVNSSATGCTIIFDMDAKFMYTGSSGSGGIALYPQSDNNTFTVNAGKTLTFVDRASMAVGSSNGSASGQNVTFNVNGTIVLSGPNSQLTLKASGGKTATMHIFNGGSVTVGNKLFASTAADGGTTALIVDGSLTAGNQVDFSNPAFMVTGSGTFTLLPGATLLIGHPDGITASGASGQIQTTTRVFDADAGYTYMGTAAQVTGDGLPSTIKRLTIDDSLGVTMTRYTSVSGLLTLARGVFSTGPWTLSIIDTASVTRTSGFVTGVLSRAIHAGTHVTATFDIGTGTTYSPVSVVFNNVTVAGTMAAEAVVGKHAGMTQIIDTAHAVNRYWRLFPSENFAFDTFDATFTFAPSDVATATDAAGFVVGKDSVGTWSVPGYGVRTATSTGATGLTRGQILVYDFVIGWPYSFLVRSNGTGGGAWNDPATWLTKAVPRHADSVAIVAGDSVAVEASDSCNTVGVQTGGKLVLDSALAVVNMGVEGTLLKNQGGGLTSTGVVGFGKGGYYIHNQAGGSIPTAVWDTNSTCEIRAALGQAPSNGNQNFYNVVWNCPDQSTNLNLGWNGNTIGGNITVIATGSSYRWQLMAPKADSTTTTTIMGDVIVQGGQFSTNGTSNANTTVIVHHYGNINVTSGNFSISRGSQGGSGTTRWYLHQGNFSLANATTQNSNSAGARFVFQKPGVQTLTLTSATVNALPIQVDSLTTLSMGTSVLRGSGSFTLNFGATLATANPGGLDSTLQMTGTRTISPYASFTFNGTHPQVTGTSLPAQLECMTIDNDSSVTLNTNVIVDSTLSVLHGHLFLDGKSVILTPTGSLHETPGHTVTGDSGTISWNGVLNAPSASVDIRGLGIKIGSSANLESTTIVRGHAAQTAGIKSIKRYFDITPSINSGLNATIVFAFDSTELNGATASALNLFRSTDAGSTWAEVGGSFKDSLGQLTLTVTGINAMSRWTAAIPATPAPAQVALVSPANNATIGADSVRCVWQKSTPSVTTYWFERGTDSLFSSSVIDSTITDTTVVTKGLLTNHTYWWRVRAKNLSGWGPYSTTRKFAAVFTGIAEGQQVPIEFSLKQNYPNPFNPATTILFTVEKTGRATMELFNILGQRVQTLFDGVVEPGTMHLVKFDGSHLPSGTYFYRLQSEGKSDIKRLLLIK